MNRVPSLSTLYFAVLLLAALASTGCTQLAESIATHLAAKDVKAFEEDFTIFEADLALFRNCLKERGGRCQGNAETPLPQSSQAANSQDVLPTAPGESPKLATSVGNLASGHPAAIAYSVLTHPVVQQATGLHNHLRGHKTDSVKGVSTQRGQGHHGGPESTINMDMKFGEMTHFHSRLLSSIGNSGWEALSGHCTSLLKESSPGPHLVLDCRRVAFVRGYLDAYLRQGEFITVDVQLAGAIQAINSAATKIEGDIQTLQSNISSLETQITSAETQTLNELSSDASQVGSDLSTLITQTEGKIVAHYGSTAQAIFSALSSLADLIASEAQQLATTAEGAVSQEIQTLVTSLNGNLTQLNTKLGDLRTKVSDVDTNVVADINNDLSSADRSLSNIFKVTNIGFVSRDSSFRARLPSIEVTFDPTAKRLFTVTDQDTGQILTTKSNLSDLGVAQDESGVGTGASIGAELTRVFLEALFDAHEGLPAASPIGGPKATGLNLGDHSLPLFNSPMGHVDSQDFSKMTQINDRIGLQARLIAGRIVSGFGPININNAPLEDLFAEIIATSIRKAAAKASWCWYACDLNSDLKNLETAAKTGIKDKVAEEETKLKTDVKKDEQRIRTWAHKEAEHVKLRLKVSR